MVSFTESIRLGFQRYFQFGGRSTRAEFWWWVLFVTVVTILLYIADVIIMDQLGYRTFIFEIGWLPMTLAFRLIVLIPGFAVSVRRLHDIDRRGSWVLYANLGWVLIIPGLVLTIMLLVWAIKQGDDGQNNHGPDPRMLKAY